MAHVLRGRHYHARSHAAAGEVLAGAAAISLLGAWLFDGGPLAWPAGLASLMFWGAFASVPAWYEFSRWREPAAIPTRETAWWLLERYVPLYAALFSVAVWLHAFGD